MVQLSHPYMTTGKTIALTRQTFVGKVKVIPKVGWTLNEESEKAGLKLSIQKTKIMASGATTSWQIDGETMETVTEFILGAPETLQMVTAAMKLKDTCSLEEKLW